MGKSRTQAQSNGRNFPGTNLKEPVLKLSKSCAKEVVTSVPSPSPLPKSDSATQTFGLGRGLIEGLKEAAEAETIAVCKAQRDLASVTSVLVTPTTVETTDELLTCQICLSAYEEKTRPPMCFPCGHTLCKSCMGKMGNHCPFDRREFSLTGERFPVNDLLLKALSRSKEPRCAVHDSQLLGYCFTDQTSICGYCIFAHLNHDYHHSESQLLVGRSKAIGQGLNQALAKVQMRVLYWDRILNALRQLVFLYHNSTLGKYNELRNNYCPYLPVMMYDEIAFQASIAALQDLCAGIYQLKEVLNSQATTLYTQIQGFSRLPLLDKLRVTLPDREEALDMEDFLQYFACVLEQLQLTYTATVNNYQLGM